MRSFLFRSCLLTLLLVYQLHPIAYAVIEERPVLEWEFPLKRTHTGILLGNGIQGLMVWGFGNQLNITLGRAGFWDHRGGNEFASKTTYDKVRDLLYKNDEEGLRKAFQIKENASGGPQRPRQIGGGRLEIILPEYFSLRKGFLSTSNGEIKIEITCAKCVLP